MIKYIDIANFGCFHNFLWKDCLRDKGNNVVHFKMLNVLYGKNYSGKTTISRIIRSLETGIIPEKIEHPSFNVETSLGKISQNQIPVTELSIRVYNKDFVDEHLSFLRDKDGKITPFTVLGNKNKEIKDRIDELTDSLGSIEKSTGLRHSYATKHHECEAKLNEKNRAESNLKDKLTKKATNPIGGIKHNPVYRDPNYNTPKITKDIEIIRATKFLPLDESEKNSREELLKEEPLPDINEKLVFKPALPTILHTADDLITKKITPNTPIQELLNDSILQAWVRDGIPQHRGKRENCGFCGQPIPSDLWKRLDEHFSKESTQLENDIESCISEIYSEINRLSSIINIDESNFYTSLTPEFRLSKESLLTETSNYKSTLAIIANSLKERKSDIFNPKRIPDFIDNQDKISQNISSINELINKNNTRTETLSSDQHAARNELRLSEIAQFISDIDLSGAERDISKLFNDYKQLHESAESIKSRIETLESEIDQLNLELRDEKKGAEKVNEYLSHYFGHGRLKLVATEDTGLSAIKFQILRNGEIAYDLSEGECSLVSFCYFMAKLCDSEAEGKKLIIYIDDPISSLDSNHIFFVFSLIESIIAKAETDDSGTTKIGDDGKPIFRYEQLFISTHNLEFLKYLKRLTRPKNNNEQFLVLGSDKGSKLELMPPHLRKYVTEFNYLFSEIYICSTPSNIDEHYHSFYNFGNSLRKFLEVFLFFKYPFINDENRDYDKRIQEFFKDEPSTDPLVHRITNEFSHLGSNIERGVNPVDHAEISRLAMFVLKKINDNDSEQFSCLLESINQPNPFSENRVREQ